MQAWFYVYLRLSKNKESPLPFLNFHTRTETINMLFQSLNIVAVLFTVFLYSQAEASITLNSTRAVFEGNKKEASVMVRNLSSDAMVRRG